MNLEEFKEEAKKQLMEKGDHMPMLFIECKEGMIIVPIQDLPSNDEERKYLRKFVKDLMEKYNSEKYFMISCGWVSHIKPEEKGEKVYRSPTRDIDRKECLIASMFMKEKNETYVILFSRKDEKVIIDDEIRIENEPMHNIYNVFEDFEEFKRLFNKFEKETNEEFIKKNAKVLTKKYFDEFDKGKTPEEKLQVLKKVIEESKQIYKEQSKTILEEVNEEEEKELDDIQKNIEENLK